MAFATKSSMKFLLAAMILAGCAVNAGAYTNALWLQTTVPPTNILSPRQICDLIEAESAKLDPAGQGLKVIFHAGFDQWGTTELQLSPAPISFYKLLDIAASAYAFPSNSAKVFDGIGVIPWAEYRYAYTAIEGHCSDAHTGNPITNFNVTGGFLGPPVLAIQTNGYFVCGIQQRFDFSQCSTATFTEHNISDVKQVLTITAPGYAPLVITNEVYRPGDKCGLRTYDIELSRAEGIHEGEHEVAGYRRQSAPQPGP